MPAPPDRPPPVAETRIFSAPLNARDELDDLCCLWSLWYWEGSDGLHGDSVGYVALLLMDKGRARATQRYLAESAVLMHLTMGHCLNLLTDLN